MRLRLTVLALMLVACPIFALGEEESFPKAGLLTAVKARQPKQVEELLFATSFDSWELGRALLTALEVYGPKSERDAFRMAAILVAKGAEVDYADDAGRTPLMRACEKRFETVASLLLEKGAALDLRDREGRKALEYVDIGTGDASAILWLLDKAGRDRKEAVRICRVKNLRAGMRSGCVVVTYDLEGEAPVPVRLKASADEGKSYAMDVSHVSGDVGDLVAPGRDRRIVWAIRKDYPNGVGGGVMVDVVASER